MNHSLVHVGIDVSKQILDIHPFDDKEPQVANNKAGIRKLIKRIKAFGKAVSVCCESSGGYEKLLAEMLLEAGIPIARVNAKRVRDYAKSQGILAKTDAIDAYVITLYSQSSCPRLLSHVPGWLRRVQNLLIRRTTLQDMIKKEKSRLSPTPDREIGLLIRAHIRTMKLQVQRIEKMLKEIITENDALKMNFNRLTEIKSIGMISALSLLAFLPELGYVTDNEAAALAGLAPYNKDSGTLKGKRAVQGGRTRIREPLYMAAVNATIHNEIWSKLYKRLINRGKPHKVALTAVMRKMVVLANRLMADPEFQIS